MTSPTAWHQALKLSAYSIARATYLRRRVMQEVGAPPRANETEYRLFATDTRPFGAPEPSGFDLEMFECVDPPPHHPDDPTQ